MIQILVRVTVADVTQFLNVFSTKGQVARRQYGCTESQVFRTEQPGRLVILYTWESRERWDSYLAASVMREVLYSGGTLSPPEITYLEKVAQLPG